jgi:hypothetical protein
MSDLVTYSPPSAGELAQTWKLAESFARTEFVPTPLRGRPEAVMACMLAGRELGIGPMQALQKIHIIQGRPTLAAELMASLVRRAGHRIRTIERTATVATVEGARTDDPDAAEKITWTWEDAKRANLVGKDNWKQYPAAMLWARAVSALCRQLFPDVLAGMSYTPDEGSDTETIWGDPEVEDSGRLDGEMAPPVQPVGATAARMRAAQDEATLTRQQADIATVPTLEQIRALKGVDQAKRWVPRDRDPFAGHVKAAIEALHHGETRLATPRAFWEKATLNDWRQALEYAVELHDQQQHETSAAGRPPASAADPDDASPVQPDGGEAEGHPGLASNHTETGESDG